MTVVLCGVGADTGNVRPVPTVDAEGQFEYVPIPETGVSAETATYGSLDRRLGTGTLADELDAVRPGSDGDWISDPAEIRQQVVHHDPNFEALTYGEHRPPYVSKLRALEPGDAVAFYAGFGSPDSAYKHRYLFGWFTVGADPVVIEPDASVEEKAALLDRHPENAHAKRFAEHGDLYAHDDGLTDRPRPVVIVPGTKPGGLLDNAVRLSDRRRGPNYYMRESVAETLAPQSRTDHGTHLGGFKPAVRCAVTAEAFGEFLDRVA